MTDRLRLALCLTYELSGRFQFRVQNNVLRHIGAITEPLSFRFLRWGDESPLAEVSFWEIGFLYYFRLGGRSTRNRGQGEYRGHREERRSSGEAFRPLPQEKRR